MINHLLNFCFPMTGDVGYYDDDCCLFVGDRVKDLIKYKTLKVFIYVYLFIVSLYIFVCSGWRDALDTTSNNHYIVRYIYYIYIYIYFQYYFL